MISQVIYIICDERLDRDLGNVLLMLTNVVDVIDRI